MCPPFWNLKKKKKKKVSDSARLYPGCYLPPWHRWRSKKKSVGVPPPPPLISFFGTCASFEAGGGPKKNSMLCPPLSQIPGSAPGGYDDNDDWYHDGGDFEEEERFIVVAPGGGGPGVTSIGGRTAREEKKTRERGYPNQVWARNARIAKRVSKIMNANLWFRAGVLKFRPAELVSLARETLLSVCSSILYR